MPKRNRKIRSVTIKKPKALLGSFDQIDPKSLEDFSRTETYLLREFQKNLEEEGYCLSEKELNKGWLKLKGILLRCLQEGHCEVDFMRMIFYWYWVDSMSARLHVKPMGEFEVFINRVNEIISRSKNVDMKKLNEYFNKWFSMKANRHLKEEDQNA